MSKIIAFDFASSGIRALAAEVLSNNTVRIFSEENRKAEAICNGVLEHPSGTAYSVPALFKELYNSSGVRNLPSTFSVSLGGKGFRIVKASVEKKLNKSKIITEEIIDKMAEECEKSYIRDGLFVYEVIPVMYEVDGVTHESPEGLKGNYITGNYHLVVGSDKVKYNLDKCMERIGNHEVDCMPLSADAFSFVVSTEDERNQGCAVINLGDTSTTLAIYRDELLQHLLVVPLGGRNITIDIEELGISDEKAEKLKRIKGVAMESMVDKPINIKIPSKHIESEHVVVSSKLLAQIVEARLEEIFYHIFDTLSVNEKEIPGGIILTGGGANLTGIREFVEQKSGISTRYGDHSGWLTEDTSEHFRDARYSQIIGTILLTKLSKEVQMQPEIIEVGKTKKKSGKRRSLREKITQGFFRFFEDDTELQTSAG